MPIFSPDGIKYSRRAMINISLTTTNCTGMEIRKEDKNVPIKPRYCIDNYELNMQIKIQTEKVCVCVEGIIQRTARLKHKNDGKVARY